MARYYFDIEHGRSDRDDEGTLVPSLRAMRQEAVEMLGQVLRDRSESFWDEADLKLTVRSDDDLVLLRLTVFGTLAPAGN